MMKIGFLYIHGLGVDKNKDKGLEWLNRAINTGNKSGVFANAFSAPRKTDPITSMMSFEVSSLRTPRLADSRATS